MIENSMDKNIFTLIKYEKGEEGSFDRCGDFIRGEESNLEILYFNDINEFAESVAYLRANTDLELTLLLNGVNMENLSFIEEINKDLYEKYSLIYEKFDYLEYEIRQNKIKEKEERLKKLKEQKELEKKQKELMYKKQIENEEKEKLIQLLKKYPNLKI